MSYPLRPRIGHTPKAGAPAHEVDPSPWFAAAGVVDDGSAEAWARAFILAPTPASKLAPPPRPQLTLGAGERSAADAGPVPAGYTSTAGPPPPSAPGRGLGYKLTARAEKMPRRGALVRASERGKLLHTFLHHEVQAAELMAYALLAFPDTPLRFRRGLLGVLGDEVRHAQGYAARLARLGVRYGDHPVRDWFWQRVPSVAGPRGFVALMGMGFEAANLEHTRQFARELEQAGDPESAAFVAAVGVEEVAHVRFATRWFQRFSGAAPDAAPDFDAWRSALPAPLTPTVLRGKPLDRERRGRAGQGPAFLDALEAW
ncbi:MAG: DUF455 family protein [Planctomycetota bacterium]